MDRHCWNLLSYGWKHKKAQTCKESVCFSVSGCVSMWFCCDCNWLQLHVWLLGCCVALLQIYGRARSSTNLHEQAWRCLSLHCDVFELSQKRNQVQCNNVPLSHCFNQCRQAGLYGKLRVCRSLDFQFVLTKRRTTFIFDLRRRRLQTMSFKMNASLGGKNVAFRQCFVSYYGKYKKKQTWMGETWLLQPLLVIATEALTHFLFLLVGLQRMHAVVLFHKGLGSAVQALHCKVSSTFQHNALFHTELKNAIFFGKIRTLQ